MSQAVPIVVQPPAVFPGVESTAVPSIVGIPGSVTFASGDTLMAMMLMSPVVVEASACE